jgi:hypothetical protein
MVATGATKSKVQVPMHFDSEAAARMTATELPLFVSVAAKPVGLTRQVN